MTLDPALFSDRIPNKHGWEDDAFGGRRKGKKSGWPAGLRRQWKRTYRRRLRARVKRALSSN